MTYFSVKQENGLQARLNKFVPFLKGPYLKQQSLKLHQDWCQMKALVLFFPVMSLDMRFGLKLSKICKKT